MKVKQFIDEAVAFGSETRAWHEKLFSRIEVSNEDDLQVFVPKGSRHWAPKFSEMTAYKYEKLVIPSRGVAFVVESDQAESFYKDGVRRIELVTSYHGLEIRIDDGDWESKP